MKLPLSLIFVNLSLFSCKTRYRALPETMIGPYKMSQITHYCLPPSINTLTTASGNPSHLTFKTVSPSLPSGLIMTIAFP